MRFLIYGAGVIGSIFAGKLFKSGNEVTILARNKRVEDISDNGLLLKDIKTNTIEGYPVKVIDNLKPDDVYDYILVTMQFTQVDKILTILAQNKSKNIVFFVNTPCGYEKWKKTLGKKLMIGFPACGGEISDGITSYYISMGITRAFQTTTFGETNGLDSERLRRIIKIFSQSGIPSTVSKNIDNWQKCHIAIVTPIANAIYKNKGDIKSLAKNRSDIRLMIDATIQGLNSLKELGYKIEPTKLNFYYLPKSVLLLVFSVVFRTSIADFSMAKHSNNAKEEMKYLQIEFDKLIKNTNTPKESIRKLNSYLL